MDKRQQHVHNFSKAYSRLQIFNSQYVPREYKQILLNMLQNREIIAKNNDPEQSLPGIDEGIAVLEKVLRSTINSIERSHTVLGVAIAFLRRYKLGENYLCVLENYSFESMFAAYMYHSENVDLIPDDHPLALPVKIIFDMLQLIASNAFKDEKTMQQERDRKRIESQEFMSNNQLLMMSDTFRHMENITKIVEVEKDTAIQKPPSLVKIFLDGDVNSIVPLPTTTKPVEITEIKEYKNPPTTTPSKCEDLEPTKQKEEKLTPSKCEDLETTTQAEEKSTPSKCEEIKEFEESTTVTKQESILEKLYKRYDDDDDDDDNANDNCIIYPITEECETSLPPESDEDDDELFTNKHYIIEKVEQPTVTKAMQIYSTIRQPVTFDYGTLQ